jgi:hypothetical protein
VGSEAVAGWAIGVGGTMGAGTGRGDRQRDRLAIIEERLEAARQGLHLQAEDGRARLGDAGRSRSALLSDC